jgi:hypothetical protein
MGSLIQQHHKKRGSSTLMELLPTNPSHNPCNMRTKTCYKKLRLNLTYTIEIKLYIRESYEMRLETPHHMPKLLAPQKFEPMKRNYIH